MIRELVTTPEGTFALFIFMFGGCLVGGIMLAALSSYKSNRCKGCGSKEHFVRTEENKSAHCPDCGASRAYQLEDRAF